ncbi:hypothetical protein HGB25_02875 [Candidatus Saccharibacteria bacterium]|nr:hypothetical protein [Candidatus Saccharibacteria bacterium]
MQHHRVAGSAEADMVQTLPPATTDADLDQMLDAVIDAGRYPVEQSGCLGTAE